MPANDLMSSHIHSTYFAPRGRRRIYQLGMQIAQLYLSPFDRIIGIIGDAGSGKSVLTKGMFPGLELTNDDNGVNVRPLPLLDQDNEQGFFTPHTYHLDIRFEMGFHQMTELADAIHQAVQRGKRVVVEHFDLIYPTLGVNADLLVGIGEEIIISRPTMFGPEPQELRNVVYKSLPYRLMAHTAEDLCESLMPEEIMERCSHGDVHHGFILTFDGDKPGLDLTQLEQRVLEAIRQDLPVDYIDESHISIGGRTLVCTGPRTHVRSTGRIENFCLLHEFIYDRKRRRYILVGCVGEGAQDRLEHFRSIAEKHLFGE